LPLPVRSCLEAFAVSGGTIRERTVGSVLTEQVQGNGNGKGKGKGREDAKLIKEMRLSR